MRHARHRPYTSFPSLSLSLSLFSCSVQPCCLCRFECQHIVHEIQRRKIRKWVVLREGAGGGIGFLTTNATKEGMMMMVRDALGVGCIAVHRQFFSTTHEPDEMLRMLKDELKAFCVITEPGKTPFAKPRKTYSGKVGGRNDDLAIALQLAVIGCRTFYSNERYARFRAC